MFELNRENAREYLRARGMPAPERVTELGGGVSNTVLLVENGAERLVLKQALGKLRVEQDWFSERTRIFREAAALRLLAPYLPGGALPEVLFEDRENCLFAMTAAPPGAPTWKSQLLEGIAQPHTAEQVAGMLGAMFVASWESPDIEREFGDQTVFDQLRLDPYYRSTAARHPELAHHFAALMDATGRRRVSLVHGDWSPKNFLVAGERVVAIDFEVIHYGDPAFDAAFLLNHLLLKSLYLPPWQELYTRLAMRFWRVLRESMPAAGWFERATLEHLACLLLARVDGKSPAEYIREERLRDQIRRLAADLMEHPRDSVGEVFEWERASGV